MEGGVELPEAKERPIENVLVVVVTSNRGLCGGFNSYLCKQGKALIEETYAAQRAAGKMTLMFIGKKGKEYFEKRYDDIKMIDEHTTLFSDLSFDNTARVSQSIMDSFVDKTYDRIDVVYAQFKNAAVQFFNTEQFLPIKKLEAEKQEGSGKQMKADFIFEPSKEVVLQEMVPTILRTQFHKFLLDTHASEHGARMTAMDKASENADDLLKELKINYNKARQAAITKELTEIVSGAMALEG